jgi:predicted small metal-binding protein
MALEPRIVHIPRKPEETPMAKVIHCNDVGFDCAGVIRAATEEEALHMAAKHAKTVHGLQEISPEVLVKVQAVIRDE